MIVREKIVVTVLPEVSHLLLQVLDFCEGVFEQSLVVTPATQCVNLSRKDRGQIDF